MAEKLTYFASANSANGFAGFFGEVFKDGNYRYILKGGPGTGKSTLMRKIGKKAEEIGYKPEYFLCSSDPDSLDGIIVHEKNIAVLDGTSPHMTDPDLPGIDSEIINLGIYWNRNKLAPYTEKAEILTAEKGLLYKRAYEYINAMTKAERIETDCINEAFDYYKASAYASRFCRHFVPKSIGSEKIRLYDSVGMKGYAVCDGYNAGTMYCIKPFFQSEYILIDEIYKVLKRKHLEMNVSFRYTDAKTVNAIYLPQFDTSIIVGETDKPDAVKINTERFIEREIFASYKNRIKMAEKCRKDLFAAVLSTFDEINKVHFDIEKIYKKAMNFTKMSKDGDKLISKILGI